MAITLQQLRYLTAVADEGSLTQAATKLGVTQPVLSRALAQLQQELGTALLKRTDRKLTLTAEGEAALIPARRAVAAAQEVQRSALRKRQAPLLNIAAQSTMLAAIAPAFHELLKRYPDMHLNLTTTESVEAMSDALANEQVDMVFGQMPALVHGARWVAWDSVEVALVSPPGLDLPDPVPLGALSHIPMISIQASTRRQKTFDDLFLRAGIRPNIVLEVEDLSVLFPMVQAGVGSFHAWRFIASRYENVVVRRFAPPQMTDIGFAYIDRRKAQVREFIDLALRQPRPAFL
jgi:LysR family cyn operon transcriptional activator